MFDFLRLELTNCFGKFWIAIAQFAELLVIMMIDFGFDGGGAGHGGFGSDGGGDGAQGKACAIP